MKNTNELTCPKSSDNYSEFPQNNIKNDNCIIVKNKIDETPSANNCFKKMDTKRRNILLITTLTLLAVLSFIVIIYLIEKLSTVLVNGEKLCDRDTNLEHDLIAQDIALRLISRDEWLAQPPAHELETLVLPVKYVIFAHTVTDNCSTQAICTVKVRLMQTFHMESRYWDDIGFNFLIGGDGAVYEGRGWDKQGAHTKGYNSGSLGIAFIGTFNTNLPPERQLQAAKNLLEEGVRLKKLSPDYKMYGHRQLIGYESPGKTLFELLKTWPHWSNEIPTS